jgi:hypothetical protein
MSAVFEGKWINDAEGPEKLYRQRTRNLRESLVRADTGRYGQT